MSEADLSPVFPQVSVTEHSPAHECEEVIAKEKVKLG